MTSPIPAKPYTPATVRQWTETKNANVQPSRKMPWLLGGETYYSAKEFQQHNKPTDGWIIDDTNTIYDITALFTWLGHPGMAPRSDGQDQSLRQPPSGGATQTAPSTLAEKIEQRLGQITPERQDKQFHGKKAQQYWDAMRIGKLDPTH